MEAAIAAAPRPAPVPVTAAVAGRSVPTAADYEQRFGASVDAVKKENRYRVFADLERQVRPRVPAAQPRLRVPVGAAPSRAGTRPSRQPVPAPLARTVCDMGVCVSARTPAPVLRVWGVGAGVGVGRSRCDLPPSVSPPCGCVRVSVR
jgi:hypothetical protein